MTTFVRKPGTRRDGGSFDEATKRAVWSKGQMVAGNNPASIRRDTCGMYMIYSQYGNRNNQYGWEIDHILPVARGGTDDLSNLQPLNWADNVKKGDTYPWRCS